MTLRPPVNIEVLLAAIVADLQAGFPQLVAVEEYSDEYLSKQAPLATPAVLIDLFEIEPQPDDDPGTGQTAVTLRFEATVALGFSQPAVERAIRVLAAEIAHRISGARFGQVIGPATLVGVEPQNFAPELDQYVAWRIEWFHRPAYLGEADWPLDGVRPTEVRLSEEPDTGPGNEEEYALVYEYDEPRP